MGVYFEDQCPYCGYIRRLGFEEPVFFPGVESEACRCWGDDDDPDCLHWDWDCA